MKEIKPNLARIETIREVIPHENADRLEIAKIRDWNVIVLKGKYHKGDRVIFIEPGVHVPAKLADRPGAEFLKGRIKNGAIHIQSIKLRGVVSQGIILPLSILNGVRIPKGGDVTEVIGAYKIVPNGSFGVKNPKKFPEFIPKTRVDRVQNYFDKFRAANGPFIATEKLNGSSITIFNQNGEIGVCSRNVRMNLNEDTIFVNAAKRLGFVDFIKNHDGFAIQGELIGPNIQKNPYKLDSHQIWVFDVFNIKEQKYFLISEALAFLNKKFPFVPIQYFVPKPDVYHSVQQVLEMAKFKSAINRNVWAEGLVFKAQFPTHFRQFKAIYYKYEN